MSGTDTTRTGFDALESPINEIPWGRNLPAVACYSHPDTLPYVRDTKGERRERRAVARLAKKKWRLAALASTAGIIATQLPADATHRLAQPGCAFTVVKPGDTVFRLAGDAKVTLDVVARLNPQIPNLNLVYPGDQVATACGERPVNEVQRVQQTEPAKALPLTEWIAERETDGRATQRAILAALYNAGARGNQLIGLAAVTEGESGRRLDAVGDKDIATGQWGPSVGPFQIRTLVAEKGKGSTRDIVRASTLEGGARSAVELYNQSQERGHNPLKPWTAHLLGWDKPHFEPYRAVAAEASML